MGGGQDFVGGELLCPFSMSADMIVFRIEYPADIFETPRGLFFYFRALEDLFVWLRDEEPELRLGRPAILVVNLQADAPTTG